MIYKRQITLSYLPVATCPLPLTLMHYEKRYATRIFIHDWACPANDGNLQRNIRATRDGSIFFQTKFQTPPTTRQQGRFLNHSNFDLFSLALASQLRLISRARVFPWLKLSCKWLQSSRKDELRETLPFSFLIAVNCFSTIRSIRRNSFPQAFF